jgi:hypothetical protein
MPFLFLILLVALGVTFIPGIGNAWTHIRNGAHVASPHMGNSGTMVGRNARSLSQSMWTGMKWSTIHTSPYVKSFLSATGSNIKAFFVSIGNIMQRDPSLWFGIGCTLVATALFAHAYVNGSYGKTFHFGLFMTISAAIFFINHHGWNHAYAFVAQRKKGFFLIVSSAWLALANEHHWSLLWPGVFTALSAIVFLGWTDSIKKSVGEGAGYIGTGIYKLLTGGYGWGISCIVYAAIIFVWGAPMFQKPGLLTGKTLDLAYNLAMVIAILAILAPILIGERVAKNKKGEKK